MNIFETSIDDLEHISDDGTRGRSYNSNGLGEHGNGFFTGSIEKPFLFEPVLQLEKGELKGSDPFRFYGF